MSSSVVTNLTCPDTTLKAMAFHYKPHLCSQVEKQALSLICLIFTYSDKIDIKIKFNILTQSGTEYPVICLIGLWSYWQGLQTMTSCVCFFSGEMVYDIQLIDLVFVKLLCKDT